MSEHRRHADDRACMCCTAVRGGGEGVGREAPRSSSRTESGIEIEIEIGFGGCGDSHLHCGTRAAEEGEETQAGRPYGSTATNRAASFFRLGQGDSIAAPAGGRVVAETRQAAKEKEKRRLDVEILKVRVDLMKNLPSSQAEAEVKQRRLEELQTTLHLISSGTQVSKPPP